MGGSSAEKQPPRMPQKQVAAVVSSRSPAADVTQQEVHAMLSDCNDECSALEVTHEKSSPGGNLHPTRLQHHAPAFSSSSLLSEETEAAFVVHEHDEDQMCTTLAPAGAQSSC